MWRQRRGWRRRRSRAVEDPGWGSLLDLVPALGLRQDQQGEDEARHRQRRLGHEDPPPPEGLDDGPARHHADDGAAGADHRPVAHRLDPALGREQPVDDGDRRRAHGGPGGGAEDAEGDERPGRPRCCGEEREHRDAHHRHGVDPTVPVEVAQLAHRRSDDREGEQRARDHPRDGARVAVQLVGDAGHGDGQDRDGEPDREQPEEGHGEDHPRVLGAGLDPPADPVAQHERPRDDLDLVGPGSVDRQLVVVLARAVHRRAGYLTLGSSPQGGGRSHRPRAARARACPTGWGGGLIAAAGERHVQLAAPADRAGAVTIHLAASAPPSPPGDVRHLRVSGGGRCRPLCPV